jgi:hypothetical protein
VLAESLKERFGNEADVLHAALVGDSERVAFYGIVNQVKVPAIDFAKALRQLGGHADLAKLDIERADVEVLQIADPSDLAACSQLTVQFHESMPPIPRRDVDRLCQRMCRQGYGIVNANWPYFDDVLFVNLRRIAAARRLRFRCRMALVNGLFVLRGAFLWSVRLLKRIRWNQLSLT